VPGYNRAELSVEIEILPSNHGAKPPREQIAAGTEAAGDSGLSTHEAGPDTTVLAGSRKVVLDAVRQVIDAALDAGARKVQVKVEAQGEAKKFGGAGGRRG
jgi:uncharacterized protein YqgV (UPF0045/DUF77 family)